MDEADAIEVLKRWESTGKLEGGEIEYYTGGGGPPPYRRSDQLRLVTVAGRDVIEFNVPVYDQRYNPYPTETYTMPAEPADVQALARLVREAGVFSSRFPEEEDPGLVHVIRTEVMVREGTREITRVYYKTIPASLSALQDAVGKMIERVKAQGERGVYHEGRRIDVE